MPNAKYFVLKSRPDCDQQFNVLFFDGSVFKFGHDFADHFDKNNAVFSFSNEEIELIDQWMNLSDCVFFDAEKHSLDDTLENLIFGI